MPRENLTPHPERIVLANAELVNEGWVRGAGEDQVLFIVRVDGRSCGYLTVAEDRTTLWIRELYLDGRTWRGSPKGDSWPMLHRGLGKLILAWWDVRARQRRRQLGVFTTHSLGLLKACDHLFGTRCLYTVTDGDPPEVRLRQRGLHWLDAVETYSALLPPDRVLVFQRADGGRFDRRDAPNPWQLVEDDPRRIHVLELATGRRYGPEEGLLVSIGPSVDVLVAPED